ncbi:hypothetical protein FXV91_11790 [Methanosarcina sp. DH2]|uniref:hypothetical protein n=1 Tax=Methanosarcina sp. DH2 TaxID=2605639 RepID=UPI001E471A16|nr:hypothetical protein [Methanosarcina sp. DH2]MCC4770835.1 hypothetical protein [Methanosarcina sp. DH2]
MVWIFCGISILYDLFLILLISDKVSSYLYPLIIFSIVFAVLAYFLIGKYVYHTIKLLNPKSLVSFLLKRNNKFPHSNSIIFDFIVGSISRHDFLSFKEGLSNFYNSSFSEENLDESQFNKIISDLIDIGTVTVSFGNDKATALVFDQIKKLFLELNTDNRRDYFYYNIDNISYFIEYCARKNLENSTIIGVDVLFNISKSILSDIPKDDSDISKFHTNILNSLLNVGKVSSEMKHERSTLRSLEYVDELVDAMTEGKNEIPLPYLTKIGSIGLISAEYHFEAPTENVLVILGKIAIISLGQINSPNNSIVDIIEKLNFSNFVIVVLNKIAECCVEYCMYNCCNTAITNYRTFKDILDDSKNSFEGDRDTSLKLKEILEGIKIYSNIEQGTKCIDPYLGYI